MPDFENTLAELPHRFDAETVKRLRQSAESAPAPLQRIVAGQCHSDACQQGRMRCPTPQACHREEHDEERPGDGAGVLLWPVAVALVVGCALAVVCGHAW
jgi:hypothetical protein